MPHPDVVPLLEADPDLGERLPADEFAAATKALPVRVLTLAAGVWHPAESWDEREHPALGLLLLEGLITREIRVAERPSTELMGAGDLLRPWDLDSDLGIPLEVDWQVMQPVQLAVLDQRFLMATARWPAIIDALASRGQRRTRWLAFQLAMRQIMRVEGRLLVLLWALSERWGVVTPRGVHLRLKLTHEALGKLVGARRPSVTTALGALADAGALERVADGYRLYGDAEQAMRRVGGAQEEAAAA